MTEPIVGFDEFKDAVADMIPVTRAHDDEPVNPAFECANCGQYAESVVQRLERIETMAFATGQQVDWLVNQLAGMFQAAANMPGLGGMMMRKMTGGNQ